MSAPRQLARFALLALLAMAGAVHADELTAPETTSSPIGPSSHVVRSFGASASAQERWLAANAGFVVTANAVVVIDAFASPALAEQLMADIRRVTPKPVSHVLLTGPGLSHAGGLATLKAAGAAIVARGPGRPAVEADANLVADTKPVLPDLALDDSTDLLIGGVHVQAVSVGSSYGAREMAYFFPEEGVLFAGDLVAPGGLPEVGLADTRRWIDALDDLLALDARVLVAGRGAPSDQPAADLMSTRAYLAQLRTAMGEALQRAEPFDEAYDKVDWSRYADRAAFDSLNRVNASNTYLQMQRERD